MIRICVTCDKKFTALGNAKTCSPECKKAHFNERMRGYYHSTPGRKEKQKARVKRLYQETYVYKRGPYKK